MNEVLSEALRHRSRKRAMRPGRLPGVRPTGAPEGGAPALGGVGGLLAAVPPEAAGAFERAFEARTGRAPALVGRVEAGEAGAIRFAG